MNVFELKINRFIVATVSTNKKRSANISANFSATGPIRMSFGYVADGVCTMIWCNF